MKRTYKNGQTSYFYSVDVVRNSAKLHDNLHNMKLTCILYMSNSCMKK